MLLVSFLIGLKVKQIYESLLAAACACVRIASSQLRYDALTRAEQGPSNVLAASASASADVLLACCNYNTQDQCPLSLSPVSDVGRNRLETYRSCASS